jgi:redox-sensing transcriptional repressor
MSIENIIPEKTIERLSEYRRVLLRLKDNGHTHLFSHTLAAKLGITAVQVRRDLMLIGFSSDTKRGYEIENMIDFIGKVLDDDNIINVGVVGMGKLGQAITRYFSGKRSKLKIVCAFDSDPRKIDAVLDDIKCYDVNTLEQTIKEQSVRMLILCLPSSEARRLMPSIINSGVRGVLNFTSAYLNFPPEIYVEDYDIITLLEKVAYFVKNSKD